MSDSAANLEAAYGDIGAIQSFSVFGNFKLLPYTEDEEEYITGISLDFADSRTFKVASAFDSKLALGLSIDRGTDPSAPK